MAPWNDNVTYQNQDSGEDTDHNIRFNTTSISLRSDVSPDDESFLDRHSSVLIYCASGLIGLVAVLVTSVVLRKIGKERHWGLPKLLVTSVQGLYKRNANQVKKQSTCK